jgi:uncharacterized zinc-type alcohol dehydrogenase-like protein
MDTVADTAAIQAYAAAGAGQPLAPFAYEPKPLGRWDVEVAIGHCGICHSDLHLIDNDWGVSTYPLVPGHEIVGRVAARGQAVTHLEDGQRVGIGWQRGACLACPECLAGRDNLCPAHRATCVGAFGGFADGIRVDGRFAFPLPQALPSEQAAPLLCGGVTVFAPFKVFGVTPRMRVAVIGIGGLGHLALQYARAFGCEVTAISSSPDKEAEALALGAHRFVPGTALARNLRAVGSFDFILSTAMANLNWGALVNALRPGGRLCLVGVPKGPLSIPAFALIGGQKSVCGSAIGSRGTILEMLDFSARHGILARTEAVPMADVNGALDKVRRNRARFRMVLTP